VGEMKPYRPRWNRPGCWPTLLPSLWN